MLRPAASIRAKLTLASLAPLVAAIAVCWVLGASLITSRLAEQTQQEILNDLESASAQLSAELSRLDDVIRLTGQSPELTAALNESRVERAVPPLKLILHNERLSFLSLVDRYGFVRYRAANPAAAGDRCTDRLFSTALQGAPISGLLVLGYEQALRENPGLDPQLVIPLRPTPHARTFTRQIENRGVYLVAAAPVLASDGSVAGVVYGGKLLNNDNHLAARISRLAFHHGSPLVRNTGNTTLFLDDVRIATTVADEQGRPAVGSLMSTEVYEAVSKGQRWAGPAHVLDQRHIASYEPLRDLHGNVIGALYVGTPEQPYQDLRTRINLVFATLLLFVTICGAGLSAWLGRRLSWPIRTLADGVRRIAAGEAHPDVPVVGRDEIGTLAAEFNTMKHRLEAREEENRALHRALEEKVAQRTHQLGEKSSELLDTQRQLAHAERLAAIGLLASGVAHEINNPLAIIRGNAELLEHACGEDARDETGVIMQQVGRIERITKNLLTFSRGSTLRIGRFRLAALLDGILDQLSHQVHLANYVIERAYGDLTVEVEGDEDQLGQVFTNLVLNGLQAMPQGGRLTVAAAVDQDGGFRVQVTDTGEGISVANQEKLFSPFFSTKRQGTGLGLAVSYGIVKDHGGEIIVESREGKGTTFTVAVPPPANPAVRQTVS